MTARVVLVFAVVALGACTLVTPPGKGDAGPYPSPTPGQPGNPPPPPPPLHAHVLYVTNLHRSSANLAPHYAGIMAAFPFELEKLGLLVDRWAVLPAYAGPEGPRLVLGGKDGTWSGEVTTTLQALAGTGRYDGAPGTPESRSLVELGAGIHDGALPPGSGGLERDAFFDQPRSLFVVVYLQSLRRRCALGEPSCAVGGAGVDAILTATRADGTASWLTFSNGGIPAEQVVHVAIATREGESPEAFRARCLKVPGFPKNLFDVMEPSPVSYFDPLLGSLNAANEGTGQSADLCDLIGTEADDALERLAARAAALAR